MQLAAEFGRQGGRWLGQAGGVRRRPRLNGVGAPNPRGLEACTLKVTYTLSCTLKVVSGPVEKLARRVEPPNCVAEPPMWLVDASRQSS